MDITLSQARELVKFFGGDEDAVFTIVEGNESFHSGKGLYVHDEYPEHGCHFLGKGGE